MREVVVGVDIGTTGAKAVAFTPDGTARATGRGAYPLRTSEDDRAEQDPAAVVEATIGAIREVVAGSDRVAALGFSAAMHSLVGLDADGRPLTPLITWADGRAASQAAALRSDGRGLALHRRTGTPIHPMSPLAKLCWFAECEPSLGVARWAGVKELVLQRLSGELVVDHGIASGTGLLSLAALDWDEEALECAGVRREQLPELVPGSRRLALTSEGAQLTGLPQETPLVVGGADGPLANLGLGAIRPGALACSIGTSGALRAVVEEPRVDERGRVFCYVLAPGRFVTGGAVNNGGVVLEWLEEAVAPDLDGKDALLAEAERAPAGSDGLLFLPYLLGERAPNWSGGERGAYVGLTRDHGREHLLRAAIEGVCLQLAVVLAALRDAGVEVREIRATGGFARSALWRRILASALGRPLGFAASPEGSSLGAALLAMTELGMLDSLERAADLVAVAHEEQPDPADAEVYAALLPAFEASAEALAELPS